MGKKTCKEQWWPCLPDTFFQAVGVRADDLQPSVKSVEIRERLFSLDS